MSQRLGSAEGFVSGGLGVFRKKEENHLGSGLDLEGEVVYAEFCDLLEERLGLLGVLVDPRLDVLEDLGPAAFNHVAEERPRRTAEANQGNSALQLLPRQRDSLVYIVELLCDVDVPVHDLGVLSVVGVLEGVGEVRPLLVDHLDCHAHGLGDDQDVGEDNGGIDESGEALNGLEGQGRSDLGVPAAGEEVARALGLVVLGEIAASYTGVSLYA